MAERDDTPATQEEKDLWRWIQLSFFSIGGAGEETEKSGAKPKRRRLVGAPRANALEHLRALDHLLVLVLGFGVGAFKAVASDTELPLSARRLLHPCFAIPNSLGRVLWLKVEWPLQQSPQNSDFYRGSVAWGLPLLDNRQ